MSRLNPVLAKPVIDCTQSQLSGSPIATSLHDGRYLDAQLRPRLRSSILLEISNLGIIRLETGNSLVHTVSVNS